MIKDNINDVRNNIEKACANSNRNTEDVTLIAVSKTKPVSMIEEAYAEGIRDFGENKVQEIISKYDLLPKDINWHMIGHLQTNKVKYIIDKVCAIHSVDSEKLLLAISKEAQKKNVIMPIFIEVNIGDEDSKFGLQYSEVKELVDKALETPGIELKGLMCVAPYVDDPEENRQYFALMKKLSVDIMKDKSHNRIDGELSMGMSGDYMIAIEEGATYVRVGSYIFGERDYSI